MRSLEMVVPDGFTREELLACLDRELRWREHVYPRRVEANRMTLLDARREMDRMRAVRAVIAQLPPTQPSLFDARARAAGQEPNR